MNIVVVGPGAMGCLFAGFLARKNADLWLLDKNKSRAEKMNAEGLIVDGISGNWQLKVKITAEPSQIGKADLVIIAVKSYDTYQASQGIKSLLKADSFVLTLQNGLGNVETIAEVVGGERVIAGITNQGATLVGIGHVRHAGRGETVIGRFDSRLTPELRRIRELLNQAGLETRITRDIKGLLWSKLIINVGINALTAITRLNNGRLVEFEGTRKILRQAVAEATKIAKRKRIKLIYDDPLAKVEAVCGATSANISSMLQDVLKKRRTEIDYINGVIVRQGQELGIPVLINALLVDLVKTIETSYHLAIEK